MSLSGNKIGIGNANSLHGRKTNTIVRISRQKIRPRYEKDTCAKIHTYQTLTSV